ncbi:hypothetical protein Q3G72_006943 [Acer saccharum]|nr:hypothetical protein Q3G72_006943 [Acer saccharum]
MVRAGDIIDETADMDIFQVSCLMELANFTFPPPTDELIAILVVHYQLQSPHYSGELSFSQALLYNQSDSDKPEEVIF